MAPLPPRRPSSTPPRTAAQVAEEEEAIRLSGMRFGPEPRSPSPPPPKPPKPGERPTYNIPIVQDLSKKRTVEVVREFNSTTDRLVQELQEKETDIKKRREYLVEQIRKTDRDSDRLKEGKEQLTRSLTQKRKLEPDASSSAGPPPKLLTAEKAPKFLSSPPVAAGKTWEAFCRARDAPRNTDPYRSRLNADERAKYRPTACPFDARVVKERSDCPWDAEPHPHLCDRPAPPESKFVVVRLEDFQQRGEAAFRECPVDPATIRVSRGGRGGRGAGGGRAPPHP